MKNFMFISRHTPTESQVKLAHDEGITLIHVGDRDAFRLNIAELKETAISLNATGVICVHPLIAMDCVTNGFEVGVFNNINRAPIGEKPDFHTTELQLRKL